MTQKSEYSDTLEYWEKSLRHIKYIQIPFEISLYIYWCMLIWRGTSHEIFFGRRAFIIVSVLGLIDLAIHLWGFVDNALTSGFRFTDEITVMELGTLLNQVTLYLRYFLAASKVKTLGDFDQGFTKRRISAMSEVDPD